LGEGGFGIAYQGEHKKTKKRVAIKEIRQDSLNEAIKD